MWGRPSEMFRHRGVGLTAALKRYARVLADR